MLRPDRLREHAGCAQRRRRQLRRRRRPDFARRRTHAIAARQVSRIRNRSSPNARLQRRSRHTRNRRRRRRRRRLRDGRSLRELAERSTYGRRTRTGPRRHRGRTAVAHATHEGGVDGQGGGSSC